MGLFVFREGLIEALDVLFEFFFFICTAASECPQGFLKDVRLMF